jgi:hypothetical protein
MDRARGWSAVALKGTVIDDDVQALVGVQAGGFLAHGRPIARSEQKKNYLWTAVTILPDGALLDIESHTFERSVWTWKEGEMSAVDRQRISAVKVMETLGYTFDGFVWNAPGAGVPIPCLHDEADAMHALLIRRADKLEACTEGSDEKGELKMIADTVSAYEAKRWPDGVVPGGKR